jgi:hypothetical protein
MLALIAAIAWSAAVAAQGNSTIGPCTDALEFDGGHLSDVCTEWLEGNNAYSATMRASISPQPASQQVMLYRMEGAWFMRVAGYRWEPGSAVETRRREFPVSDGDAQVIVDRMTIAHLDELGELLYYGSENVICTDGASYELAMAINGQRRNARQHSCAGKTELHQTAAIFRQIALKYDPEFAGMLRGFAE